MNLYFLTDESEKSLAPFFSKRVLETVMAGVAIVGVFLMVFWSRRPPAEFFAAGRGPTIFFLVFAATLLVYSYVSLCCGGGELVRRGFHMINYGSDKPTYEKEIAFFRYGLIEFVLHTILLLLPFLPLLSLAAFGSTVSMTTFTMAVSILFAASLLCRMAGFLVYLLWGRSSTLGYFAARLAMIFFVFATLFFAPAVNPLRLLYLLNHNPDRSGHLFAIYLTAVSVAILALILISNALVNRHRNQKNELK
jgi:uncharacterized membrane protein